MFLNSPARGKRSAIVLRGWWPALARHLLGRGLARLRYGSLSLTLPSGQTLQHCADLPGPHAQLHLHSWAMLARVLWRGDLGFAESFAAGEWTSHDLTRVIALAAANLDALDQLMDGSRPMHMLRRVTHLLRSNSLKGSRRNIAFHYDLGNDFYRLWLDESMTYSSAMAIAPGQSLEQAQAARLDHIAGLLGLEPQHRVLEIGCGWGALAARLAPDCAQVTGLTLSREQLAHAKAMNAANGHVDLRLQDYREVDGSFERVVSIEMLEAVGEAWWPAYFQTLHDRLTPGGRAVVQAITIAERRFGRYRETPDFIQHYIFPGGMLPTRSHLREHAEAAGLRLVHSETFARGYAETLAEWQRRFAAQAGPLAAMGYDARFQRLWHYYLAYCEAGFLSGQIDVGLYVMERAG